MKLLTPMLIYFFSFTATAFQSNDVNLNLGVGRFGVRGNLGVSVEQYFSDKYAYSFALANDEIGKTISIGFVSAGNTIQYPEDSFWDQCLFVFECDTQIKLGLHAQHANASTVVVRDYESTSNSEYQTAEKWLAIYSFGFVNTFRNNLTLDIQLSYRMIFAGGTATLVSGSPADDRALIEKGYRVFGFNIGIGYLF